jgi:hypothetical protein
LDITEDLGQEDPNITKAAGDQTKHKNMCYPEFGYALDINFPGVLDVENHCEL